LDGADKNPSPVFARGYYSGAFVAAYDWDGVTLKERWVSRNTQSGKGLWGEGAHWISVGDCDDDGKQEIIYGSAALDHDGSLLYRTGLGHGDALHLGDFLPEREGMEVFMVHEKKPYGYDLRDAKTGTFIHHVTASGDTGRGLAAHFDSSSDNSQFIYSASSGMFDCLTGNEIASSWAIGSSGAGINCRVYWDGDLYDEFFDKSIIAHWNPTGKWFDRYKFNGGNYLWGNLNNSTKFNPCVLGDLLGDWREEIVTWNGDDCSLYICATNYESDFRIPHLMDDLNYRAQVINQNCCYNQPPHLSFDPAIKYKGNPNRAVQEDEIDPVAVESMEATRTVEGPEAIYTIQGTRVKEPTAPGFYIKGRKKIYVK
jgi:rhamnogalacturonan endolyase